MENIEAIQARVLAALPDAKISIQRNGSPSGQHSLVIDGAHAREVARFLRDDPELQMDFCSNATGVDWPERTVVEKIKMKKLVDGVEKEVEETKETKFPAYLEAVYHLYSMAKKHGPVIIRLRTDLGFPT